jgi:hypothetical protein
VAAPLPPRAARSLGAVSLSAAALAALTTWHSLGVYLPTLNTPHTSLEGVAHPPSSIPPTPGLCRRLSVFVLDGLSYDAARELVELGPLRRQGVLRSLRVDFPTYTSPAIVSFVTGLGPRDSGTRRNGDLGGVAGLDTVTRAAGDAGVPVSVWSRGFVREFEELLGPPPGSPIHDGKFAIAADMAARGLAGGRALEPVEGKTPARAIDFFHYGEIDDAGHYRGGGASPGYLEAARDAAALVARYARTLDLDQDALVVLSDHGHVPEGGHGGAEEAVSHALFLGVGSFFRRGVELGERPMRDVAATLSVLAGVRAPTSALGLPMLDALTLDDHQTSFVLAAPFDQAAHFTCQLAPDPRCAAVDPLVARLRKPDPAAWEEARELHAALEGARDRELAGRRARGAQRRAATAAGIFALGWAAALVLLRRRGARFFAGMGPSAFAAPLVNAAVFWGYLLALGYRPTFSLMRPAPVFMKESVPGGLLAAAAVALLCRLSRPGPNAPWLLMAASLAPFGVLAAWVGWDPTTVPPPLEGVLVFELGPAMISACLGAVVMALIDVRRDRPA